MLHKCCHEGANVFPFQISVFFFEKKNVNGLTFIEKDLIYVSMHLCVKDRKRIMPFKKKKEIGKA